MTQKGHNLEIRIAVQDDTSLFRSSTYTKKSTGFLTQKKVMSAFASQLGWRAKTVLIETAGVETCRWVEFSEGTPVYERNVP